MKEHKCSTCGESRPEKFEPDRKSKCSKCRHREKNFRHQASQAYKDKQAVYYRRWYAEHGRKRNPNYREIILLWQKNNKEQCSISKKLISAVRSGKVEKPLKCVHCNREGWIVGHHENYNLPYEVIWLCASCHKKIHQGLDTSQGAGAN